VQTYYELNPHAQLAYSAGSKRSEAAARDWQVLAECSRPAFADEWPMYTGLPTVAFGPRRLQTAVTLN
jgi:hypothetical protein